MKTNYCTLFAVLTAALLTTTWTYAAPQEQAPKSEQTDSGKSTMIDLRPKMKGMKLKEGANLVYTGPDFKLTAILQNGKVARWNATDSKGKALRTTVSHAIIKCEVCVTIDTGHGTRQTCVEVDCSILTKATATKAR